LDPVSGLKRALASAKAGQRSLWSRFRTFQVAPRISPILSGRLSLQQTDCMGRGRLMVIAGVEGPKRGRKPRAQRATTRFHHAARRRGGVAARGARTSSQTACGASVCSCR
jgi:hypothetical protein